MKFAKSNVQIEMTHEMHKWNVQNEMSMECHIF
jgi:hypothetical protein